MKLTTYKHGVRSLSKNIWSYTAAPSIHVPGVVLNEPTDCHVILLLLLFIHYLQLGRHPVAGVVTCYISTDYEGCTLKFRYGGLNEKHVVATWNCREPSQHLL